MRTARTFLVLALLAKTACGGKTGDCEDVCDAWLCVHPTRGLVGGGGSWWPGYGIYEAKK